MSIYSLFRDNKSHLLQKRLFTLLCVFSISASLLTDSYALPTEGVVAAGSAEITNPNSSTLQVNQQTNNAVVNWESFNVAPQEQVHFQQPNSSSIILNRINPYQGVSEIYGTISANGQVWLVNPAGIYFGSTARVDVAGILATTAGISNEDFMSGNYHFVESPDWHGAIINDGMIKTAEAGLVALVGSGVVNNGYIEANLGTVILGSGSEYTIQFSGNNLIEFTIDKPITEPARDRHGKVLSDGVKNSGVIIANGGKIIMSAKAARKILDNAINMTGVAQAQSVGVKNGVIILAGGKKGKVHITGKLIASGKKSGEKGGNVYITGRHINLYQGAVVDVAGDFGGGEVLIGGDYQGKNPAIQNAKNTFVASDVIINADALTKGDAGKVIVWSDKNTSFYGTILARGGIQGGNGGFVETSGKNYLDVNNAVIDLRAPLGSIGTWLLDPTNIYIAANQSNATAAGMSGADNTADFGTTSFQATGAIQDSLLTTTTLNSALALANVVVTTTNAAGTGVGNITVVDPITWATGSTLTLTAANNIAINAGITTGSGTSALILNATGNVTQTAAIGGSGGLTKQGVGTLFLSQNNTYTGTTTVTSGIVNLQHNSGLGSIAGATTIASGASVQVNGSGLLIAEPISSVIGTGVSSSGAIVNLANSNEWSGAIALGAGGATITSNAGVLTLSGGITGAARPLTIAGAGDVVINSVIGTTTGTLTKNSSGLLTLTAINTYSGATAINAGQLILSDNGSALSTAFSVASHAKLTLDNSITNNSDRIANALTLNGGEFEIIGNNSANTTESVGALTLPLGYSTVTVTPNTNFNTQLTFASLSRSAGAEILFRGVNLGQNTVVSQTPNNSNIVFIAAPTLTGGGGTSGTTTVSILGGAIGDGGVTGNIGSGTDFVTYNPTGGSVNGLRPLLSSEYAATPAANVNLKLTSNRIADDTFSINSLLLSGGVTYNFDSAGAANTITIGGAALSGNILSIGGANVIQTTAATSGNLAFGTAEAKIFAVSDLTFGANVPVTGTGSLSKNGAGTLLENRSVALTGGVRVNSGTLIAGAANVFSTAQAYTVLAPGTLDFNGFNISMTGLTLNSGATTGATVATGNTGTLTLNGNVTLNANGSGAIGSTLSGNVALGGTTRTFAINDGIATNDLTISALISDGVAGITKTGNGTLSLSGANTYAGLTTVSAGTLDIANASGLGSTANGVTVSGTLQLNNVAVGSEAITLNNGGILSGTGNSSLNGNITLGGTAATRTISTLLGSDVLTLNGTIDGLAAALTVGGLGTVNFQNTVGAVTPLTTITTNAGSTLGVNGGLIQTSGVQTYNGIVNMTVAPATFTVTGALSDILMPNTLNNINQTLTYAVSGAGSIRDITLANNSASAVIPTLPSGLRNLSLTFNNAAIDLPALTLTGTLTAFSLGGDMSQSGPLVIAGVTTLGSGSFNTDLSNVNNNFGSVTVNGGVNVTVRDSNTINLGGATAAVSGNYNVIANGTITDSARISANTLTTSSVGGTTVDFANHTISNFNATNTTSGGITLVNTVPLTLTGISQTGTTVSITNTGTVSVPNGVTIGSGTTLSIVADDLNLNSTGALASGTTTSITQRLAGGSIGLGNTSGTMTISGSELQRITATALTLTNSTDGAIIVDGINAANTANIAGAITLNATTGTLGTLSFINNASSFRTLTTTSDAGTSIGTNLATTVGALSLTVTGGALSVANGATATSNTTLAVAANDLNLNSTGALTSTTTMSVAENAVGGTLGLGNTAGTMSISGAELQRMTSTGLTLTNASDSSIIVDGITAANTSSVSGAITLSAITGTLGTISFINTPSIFRTLTATSDAGTTVGVNLATSLGALAFTVNTGTLSVLDGAIASSNTTLAVSANDLNLNTTGALNSATTMSVTQNIAGASIGLGNTAGAMTISGLELQRMSGTGLTITNSNNGAITADGISAANSANISGAITLTATTGTTGTLSFINNPSSFRTLTTTSDAGTTISSDVATTVGGLSLTVNTGNLSIADGASANSGSTIAITANDLNLNTTGQLNSGTSTTITNNIANSDIGLGNVAGSMSISGTELQNIHASTLSIIAASNGNILVDGVTNANTANITGATSLTATNGTLGAVSFQTSPSSFANGLTVSSDNTVNVADGVTVATHDSAMSMTASDINLNTTGALNSGSGNITLTPNAGAFGIGDAVGIMSLSGAELQRITANNLTLNNANNSSILVDNVQAANVANIQGNVILNAVTGTNGNVVFQNNASTFKSLSVLAQDVITINVPITTTVGNLSINSNTVGLTGTTNLNANVTSAGSVTFTAPTAGIVLGTSVVVTGNGVTFNSPLNGSFDLTINAGSGDLTFVGNVGSSSRLGDLTINTVNNISNASQLNLTNYNQLAGNLTSFGATGLNATNSAVITANNVTGNVNVSALSIDTSAANLTGFVNGQSGEAAIQNIVLLNTITAGTHFFDGIDMFDPVPPTPTPSPVPSIPTGIIPGVMSYYQYLPGESGTLVSQSDLTGQIYFEDESRRCIYLSNDIILCSSYDGA